VDLWWGLGSKPKIVEFWCPTWSLGFRFRLGKLFSSERRYGTNGPIGYQIPERSQQKEVSSLLGLLSTIIRGGEQSDQESATCRKIILPNEHQWAPITSTRQLLHAESPVPARGVWAIRPGSVLFLKEKICFRALSVVAIGSKGLFSQFSDITPCALTDLGHPSSFLRRQAFMTNTKKNFDDQTAHERRMNMIYPSISQRKR